jgi:hypothetical protein
MKNAFLLLGLLSLCGFLHGQDENSNNNSLRFGLNRADFGASDMIGFGIYSECSYSLNGYFALVPRLMMTQTNLRKHIYYSHASIFGSSFSIRLTPMPKKFKRFKLDVGGLYQSFIRTYGTIGPIDSNGKYYSPESYLIIKNQFGLIGSLNINILDSKKTDLGIRLDLLSTIKDGSINLDSWQTGLYFGLDL